MLTTPADRASARRALLRHHPETDALGDAVALLPRFPRSRALWPFVVRTARGWLVRVPAEERCPP